MLELLDIHKHYGSLRANDGVTIAVERGSIHGILGENGAGKSTLMKVLAGFITADSGEIRLDGESLPTGSTKRSLESGVGLLHQDPLHCMPFSVLDNFMLGRPESFILDHSTAQAELNRLSDEFGFSLDPDVPVRTLTIGERQQLEIVRLLSLGIRVLILDEPTTAISAEQRTSLFATLRTLAGQGMIVLFVSHKLEEVDEICDRVSVLRLGRLVGEAELPVPTERLVEMMFGEMIVQSPRVTAEPGEPVIDLESISLHDRLVTLDDISVKVHTAEVVGLAGLEGSGQQTLLRVAAGLLSPARGSVRIGGETLTGRGYRRHLDAGVHYLPADRLGEGLVEGLTVKEHFALAGIEPQGFLLDWERASSEATARIEEFSVKGTVDSTPESLSGGNQQRLLLAMMPEKISLLVMEHPTRGLDIESAELVWTRLLARRSDRTAILFASADLDELLRYSDRIVVFFAGRILAVLDATETDSEAIGYLIGGKERV